MEELESWLKKMENGTIGEARTRELLIDRFWILDRSVDIDGADLIIQQRIKRNLIDIKPHRLGIVQAKYREELTGIQIKEDYVENDKGEPREGFFLFVHSGKEKEKKCWFFSSSDLVDLKQEIFDESGDVYVLGDTINWENFVLDDITNVLNRIDNGLKNAEITLNNEFIEKHIVSTEKDFADKYNLNLHVDSDQNSIIDLVLPFKNDVRDATKLIWQDLSKLIKLHNEEDPLKFYDGLLSRYQSNLSGDHYLLTNIQEAIEKLKDSSIRIQDNDFNIENQIKNYNRIYTELEMSKNLVLMNLIERKIKSTIIKEVKKCIKKLGNNKNKILQHKYNTTFKINISKGKTVSKSNVVTTEMKSESEEYQIYMEIENNTIQIVSLWWLYDKRQLEQDIADQLIYLFRRDHNPRLVFHLLN